MARSSLQVAHVLALLAAAVSVTFAAGCGGSGEGGTTYGSPAAEGEALSVSAVLAKAVELEGKQVRVEGTVADVCATRGCWIKLADETEPVTIVVKVEDGVIVFPLDAKGKWAVADGIVRRPKLTLEATRTRLAKEAADAGKPFDPATVTESMTTVRLDGVGARIRDRK